MKNPIFGILFFVHITIFRPEALVWGSLAFGRLHMNTALIILLSYFIHGRYGQGEISKIHQNKGLVFFLIFILWIFVVTLFAKISIELSFNQTIELTKIFILCFLFAKLINTEKRIELYVWVASISFGMLSFWGFMQGLEGNARLDTLWPGGSNYVAAQLALMAPFVLAKVFDLTLSLKYRLGFLVCVLMIVLCCIYTDSRGGFIGLSIGIFVFLSRVKQRVRVLAGLVVLVVLIYPWVPNSYFDRIESIFAEEQEQDASAASRYVLWQIALRIWQDHPITGVGLQNFSPVKETYIDKVGDIVTSEEMYRLIFNRQRHPHGLYPGMMAEAGLIGASLYLTLLFRGIFCRFPNLSSSRPSLYLQVRGAQAGLFGFAIAALFGDFQYIETFYLQLFFVWAVRAYSDHLLTEHNVNTNVHNNFKKKSQIYKYNIDREVLI
jgi:probable O-glycosylation ligase (exosortase A-associated)